MNPSLMSRYKNCIERAHSIMHKDETWRNVSIEEGIDFLQTRDKNITEHKIWLFCNYYNVLQISDETNKQLYNKLFAIIKNFWTITQIYFHVSLLKDYV